MYYDVMAKIKNASAARKRTLKVPYNAMDMGVLEVLAGAGFVRGVERKGKGGKRIIAVSLADAKRKVEGVRFLSKPSRRLYTGYRDLKPVRNGYGIAILSTPLGIVNGAEARKKKVGGELLFEVW